MWNSWTGAATHLFIPLIVTNSEGWDPGPANLKEFVQRRVHFDPDPVTGLPPSAI